MKAAIGLAVHVPKPCQAKTVDFVQPQLQLLAVLDTSTANQIVTGYTIYRVAEYLGVHFLP